MKYNGEECFPTEFEGYYCTKSGKILTSKVKGGRGKIDNNNIREHCYKIDKYGYKTCCFSEKGKHYYKTVHTVIWRAFNGKPPDGYTVDHINNNKLDNSLNNLQLLTSLENSTKRNTKCMNHRKAKYKVNNQIYDREQLNKLFGLTKDDFIKLNHGIYTKRVKSLGIIIERM